MRRLLLALTALVIAVPTTAYAASNFTDVPEDAFYAEAVDWAFTNGITTGTSDTTFEPNAGTTRGQVVTFLKRYHDAFGINLADIPTPPDNTDVLAGLDCAVGQVPKWDGSAWSCADDIDTDTTIPDTDTTIPNTDTLADLTCIASQVVINDGGWRCADPILHRAPTGVVTERTLDAAGINGLYAAVAIGDDGNPILAHRQIAGSGLLLYVCSTADCASGTTVDVPGDGNDADIAINGSGNPVIAGRRSANGLEVYACADATCGSGTNHTLLSTGNTGRDLSMAVGQDGFPVITHTDRDNWDLEIYVCSAADCSSGTNHTLETAGTVGLHTAVAIGVDGFPIVVHSDEDNRTMEVYACSATDCSSGTNHTLDTGGQYGFSTSIAIGATGNPVISFYDATGDDLEFFACASSDCSSGTHRTLASDGDVGFQSSIGLGEDDFPLIAYDRDADGIDVYDCADATCSIGSVFSLLTGVPARDGIDLAVGQEGDLVIAYADGAGTDLAALFAPIDIAIAFD